jgi:anionic cell wall polymer biosynthesis LytR-Cps2A-Psr (LCP) family protein
MIKKFLIAILGLFAAYFLFLTLKARLFYQRIYTPQKTQVEEKNEYNFLLFGYGGGEHEGTYLTDTIIVLHIDKKNKNAVLLSIPRDLWVPIPTQSGQSYHSKINAVYQMELFAQNYPDVSKKYFGDKKDAAFFKHLISLVIGQKIDYYASIDFKGFEKAIDALGGVDVMVEKSFVDEEYPVDGKEKDLCGKDEIFIKAEKILNNSAAEDERNEILKDEAVSEFVQQATQAPYLAFPCRYERLVFNKGLTHMDGKTALKFVRSRHSSDDGGDFARARRQQLFLQALINKALNLDMTVKIFPLLESLGDHLKIDISPDFIKKNIGEAKNLGEYQLKTYVLSTDNLLENSVSSDGQYILIPKAGLDNFTKIHEEINKLFSFQEATPSANK